MGNYPRFFGKDASNLPADPLDSVTAEIKRIRNDMERIETDLRFILILLREGYRDR